MEGYAVDRVVTGFSYPLVAKYAEAGGNVTLSGAKVLARGVGVDLSINTASDNDFYADNALAESETGTFESGNLKLTVGGLFDEAKRFISGQPEPEKVTFGEAEVEWAKTMTDAQAPYIAVGFVVEYRSNGKKIYQPYALPKTKFKPVGVLAQTRGKTVNWQTQDLEAVIHRAADGAWKWDGAVFTTEAEAKAALNATFGLVEA